MDRRAAGRTLIGVGCAYEIVALMSRAPTITEVIKASGRANPVGRLLVWAWCGFIA